MDNDFFYSLDKLVEFGLGTSAAAQMINTMNNSIANMTTPGADNLMLASKDPIYYVALDSVASGPYSSTELTRLIAEGKVSKETYIWKPGMPKWEYAGGLQDVLKLVAMTPPPLPQ